MAADLVFVDPDLVPLTTFHFDLVPGESDPLVAWLVNNGDEAAHSVVLEVAERATGEAEWHFADRPIVAGRRLRATVTGGYGGLSVPLLARDVGAGAPLELGTIPAGQGVKLSLVVNSPIDQAATSLELALVLRTGEGDVIDYAREQLGQGNVFPVRDPLAFGLAFAGGVVEQDPVSAFVDVINVGGLVAGIPVFVPSASVELTATDGAAAALASGEAYAAALYLGAEGVALVKGLKAAAPLSPTNRPALTGEQQLNLVAWVVRDFDGLVADADITPAAIPRWGACRAEGGNLVFGPGVFHVAGLRTVRDSEQAVAVAADDLFWVYRLRSGDLAVTTSDLAKPAAPSADAVEIASGTAAAGVVTSFSAARGWLPRPSALTFVLPSPAVDVQQVLAIGPDRDLYVSPLPSAIRMQLGDAGTLTMGAFEVALEVAAPGVLPLVWSELTGDRPAVEHDSASGFAEVGPAECRIPAGSLIRARVTDAATGAAPDYVVVSVEAL